MGCRHYLIFPLTSLKRNAASASDVLHDAMEEMKGGDFSANKRGNPITISRIPPDGKFAR